jgi:hypothetical protein
MAIVIDTVIVTDQVGAGLEMKTDMAAAAVATEVATEAATEAAPLASAEIAMIGTAVADMATGVGVTDMVTVIVTETVTIGLVVAGLEVAVGMTTETETGGAEIGIVMTDMAVADTAVETVAEDLEVVPPVDMMTETETEERGGDMVADGIGIETEIVPTGTIVTVAVTAVIRTGIMSQNEAGDALPLLVVLNGIQIGLTHLLLLMTTSQENVAFLAVMTIAVQRKRTWSESLRTFLNLPPTHSPHNNHFPHLWPSWLCRWIVPNVSNLHILIIATKP